MKTILFAAILMTSVSLAKNDGKIGILSVQELKQSFDRFQILDSRARGAFTDGHIPKSRSVDWKDWTEERPGLWNAIFGNPSKWGKVSPDAERVANGLSALGLSNDTAVVVCGQPGAWGEEGRVAWNLLYWGIDEIYLLDGGFPAWKAAYPKEVETGSPKKPNAGKFQIHLRPSRRAELEAVKTAVEKQASTLLDARAPEEFAGEKLAGQKRGGRLPSATLVPAQLLYKTNGNYVGKEELKELINTELRSPISYCVGGVRSALVALLIEARLGILVANYDGSMWEWSRREELPLEN